MSEEDDYFKSESFLVNCASDYFLALMRMFCSLASWLVGCFGLGSKSTSHPSGAENVKFCSRAAMKM